MKEQIHGGDVYRHPEAIDFSSNVNPYGTPQSVIDAAMKSLLQIAHYPDVFYSELKSALAGYENISQDYIICGNGAAELIFSLVQARKPQRALLPAPTFAEYEQALKAVGCRIDYYPLAADFELSRGILQAITPDVDILFLCNPNNPTGLLIASDFLHEIQKRCQECNTFLVIDECFLDFIVDDKDYTMKDELNNDQGLFILKAFTKRYAMAGIRLGYGLCSDQALLEQMRMVTQPWNVSIPAQAAGVAALQETAYVKRARELVQRENAYLKAELKKLPLKVYDSKANYIFFEGPHDLYQRCIAKCILIRDCANYPGLSKGYYRIAVKTHRENEKLIQVFNEVL